MKIFLGTLGTLSFLLLSGCILLNVATALVFIFRRNENKKADLAFAAMLLAFAGTCGHHVLILQGTYTARPGLLFLPVYLTLALGAALFFSVKLRLFPSYRFVGSDAKHLVLPVGQILYFVLLFAFYSPAFRHDWGRKLWSPFFGGVEMGLYIATFYLYLFGAYRYAQFQISALRKKQQGGQPLFEAFVLRRMLRVMILLFWVNSAYIVADFVVSDLLQFNLHNLRGFTRIGDLSFGAMAGWAGLSGLQLLLKMPYLNASSLVFSFVKKILKNNRRQ